MILRRLGRNLAFISSLWTGRPTFGNLATTTTMASAVSSTNGTVTGVADTLFQSEHTHHPFPYATSCLSSRDAWRVLRVWHGVCARDGGDGHGDGSAHQ